MTEPVGGPLVGTVVLDLSRALARPHSPDGKPAGRMEHVHPPLLGEHDAAVRAWATDAS